ncbi:Peptidase family M28 [Arenibacter nanhaiticus]|uniref:Vacuolar membrane protease n=1 Tax=Arenibacter nanhaiticus TaxID=558155 RepID=A0A1M6LLB4_9FLAO|nr:M28 family peptidase [Arenibacter nanhaiticus]SHJ71902.1 Peptidase family M28 [Arenibacter nanhaiticus]
MKNIHSVSSLLLILLAIFWSFKSSMPSYTPHSSIADTLFSTDRALVHVENMSKEPHAVGFVAHSDVREYLISALKNLGLQPSIQEGYTAGDWGNLSKATNILARIKGSNPGKALLLLSHYDSSPHSSLGASDAASGVATILEGIRAFLHENKLPKNDIIILFTDAEELGLNGADLFVNQHPWAKEIGLALNFEARGSGGPSYMLIETNKGNANLIKEFTAADPQYPVANSLVYSIYKMLPNDTDLTVFREDMDIEGMNFAFIDDHYDYHTFRDDYDRLDRNTLAHQGSYLMPLLKHFSEADLGRLQTINDSVYFNVPFFKMVSYPFEYIFPMLLLAVVTFIILMILGFQKRRLNIKEIALGAIPLFLALVINGLIGYFSWPVLKWAYPEYQDILQGFTYNGYSYIAAFTLLSVGVSFWCYHKFGKGSTQNLLVAPLLLWLLICGGLAFYLKGGSFFIIPVYGLLASLLILINQKSPHSILMLLLTLPAIWIFSPFIKMFPVGLGLKMMIASTLLTTLTFFLLLPALGTFKKKLQYATLSLLLGISFLIAAHFSASYTVDRANPTSLVYLLDADKNQAHWATYDHVLSGWTAQYIGVQKEHPQPNEHKTLSSKYGTGFTQLSAAPLKSISPPLITTNKDTIVGGYRHLDISISPQREVNRLEIFTNDIPISKAIINTIPLSDYFLAHRTNGKLISHYISNNEDTHLQLTIPRDSTLALTIYEASNDLLHNPLFSVPQRPQDNIPKPFVLNDAVIITKTIRF